MSVNEDSDRLQENNDIDGSSGAVTPGIYYPTNRFSSHQKPFRRKLDRIVSKNGDLNIRKFKHKSYGYFSRWFITMIESRWRWTLLQLFVAFTFQWGFFGFIYWMICLVHGDLSLEHLPPNQNGTQWTPCIQNINGLTSTILFSIEVHSTIAYGHRRVTLDCPQTIIAICLQFIMSSISHAFMIGILFAKLTRPKARPQTMVFSKHAVVNLRDDKLCMIFRVADTRMSKILNIKAAVYILKLDLEYKDTEKFDQMELKVKMDGCESTLFLPLSIIHIIDESSPLYNLSAADLLCGKLEMMLVLEGVTQFSQPVQARTSYLESDILWGYRFAPMVINDDTKPLYDVDFSKFNVTEQIDTPLCSASEYDYVIMLLKSDENHELLNTVK